MALRRTGGPWLCALAAALALGCSPGEESPAAPAVEAGADAASVPDDAAAQFDAPPADVQSAEKVRCLVDSPPGCDGCDKGDACVYEERTRYDCIYVIYGTDCSIK